MGAPPVGSSGLPPHTQTPQPFDIDALFNKNPQQIRNACEAYYWTQGNNLEIYGNILFDIANKEGPTFDEKAVVLEALSESWIYPIAMSYLLRTDPFKFLYVFYNIENEGPRRKAINESYSIYQYSSNQKFSQCFTEIHKQEWSIQDKQRYIVRLLDSFTSEQRELFIADHVLSFSGNIFRLAKDMLLIFQHAEAYARAIHLRYPSVQKAFLEATASHLQYPYPCTPPVCQQLIWKLKENDIRTIFPDLPPSQQALVAGSIQVDFFRILLQALPEDSQQSQEKPKKVVLFEHLACFPGGAAHFLSALPATQFADFIRDITKYESPAACTILPSLSEQSSQTFFLNIDATIRTDFIRFVFPKDPEGRRNYISILSKNLPLANYLTSISTIAIPRDDGAPANLTITFIIENVVQAAHNIETGDSIVGYKDDLHAILPLMIAVAFLNGELRDKLYSIIEHLSEEQIQIIATIIPQQLSLEFIENTSNLFGNYYRCLPQEILQTYSRSLAIEILSLKSKTEEQYNKYQGHHEALKKKFQDEKSPVNSDIYMDVVTDHATLQALQRKALARIKLWNKVLTQLPSSAEKNTQTSVLNDCEDAIKNQIKQLNDTSSEYYFNRNSYEVERSESPEQEDEIISQITLGNLPHLGLERHADFPAYGLTTNAELAHLGITPQSINALDTLISKLIGLIQPTPDDIAKNEGEEKTLRARVVLQDQFRPLFSAGVSFASPEMRDLLTRVGDRFAQPEDSSITDGLRSLITPKIIQTFRTLSKQLDGMRQIKLVNLEKQFQNESDRVLAEHLEFEDSIRAAQEANPVHVSFGEPEEGDNNQALQATLLQKQANLRAEHDARVKNCSEDHEQCVEDFRSLISLMESKCALTVGEMIKLAKALHYLTSLDFYFHQENLAENWKELNSEGISDLDQLTEKYTINPGELFTLNALIDRIKKKDPMTP